MKNTVAITIWSFICYLGSDNIIQEVYKPDMYIP